MRSALLLIPLLLLACVPIQPPTPADSIAQLKGACNSACGSSAQATVFLPENSSLYTTQEAICILQGKQLFCGTCACGTYGLAPAAILDPGAARNATCSFTDVGDALNVTCG